MKLSHSSPWNGWCGKFQDSQLDLHILTIISYSRRQSARSQVAALLAAHPSNLKVKIKIRFIAMSLISRDGFDSSTSDKTRN